MLHSRKRKLHLPPLLRNFSATSSSLDDQKTHLDLQIRAPLVGPGGMVCLSNSRDCTVVVYLVAVAGDAPRSFRDFCACRRVRCPLLRFWSGGGLYIQLGVVLDYAMFRPRIEVPISQGELQRLGLFILISVLVAGLARQRSRAETQADEVRQQLAAIVTSSEDAIISFTVDGFVTSWNLGAETLYGYSASEIIGRPLSVLVPTERIGELENNLDRLNREERMGSYETEQIHKNGGRLQVLLSISPIRNENGELVGASEIARDISQRKRTEEALRRNERLATAGRLTAAIAHEIRNPLEALINLVYLARRDAAGRDEYLRLAEQEIGRLDSIAQQALGFVREATSPERLDASKLLDEVVQLYLRKLQQSKIKIDRQSQDNIEIFGFPGELRQLFSNLILNAMESMKEGGRLRLRVVRMQEKSGDQRAGVRVTVADTGSGISAGALPHIFEPFYTDQEGERHRVGALARVRHRAKAYRLDPGSQPHHSRQQHGHGFYGFFA